MKPDWRDTVRVASDVAVLGLLMVATSLPVLTTGAAFATASYAVHQFLTHDRWPSLRMTWQVFRRTLLPGALATAAVAAAVWLVTVDLAAVSRGAVPGGAVLLGLTAVIAAAAAGYAALALVALGTNLATTTYAPATWLGAAPASDTDAKGVAGDTLAGGVTGGTAGTPRAPARRHRRHRPPEAPWTPVAPRARVPGARRRVPPSRPGRGPWPPRPGSSAWPACSRCWCTRSWRPAWSATPSTRCTWSPVA